MTTRSNQAAAVEEPIAPGLHSLRLWRRATAQQRSAAGGVRICRTMVAAAALAFSGCSDPVVTVENRAAVTVDSIVVSGTGFSNWLGSLTPNASRRLTIHPKGETGVRLRGEAGNRQVDSGEGNGYCEPGNGYRVKMIVETNLSVSITVDF